MLISSHDTTFLTLPALNEQQTLSIAINDHTILPAKVTHDGKFLHTHISRLEVTITTSSINNNMS